MLDDNSFMPFIHLPAREVVGVALIALAGELFESDALCGAVCIGEHHGDVGLREDLGHGEICLIVTYPPR